MGLTLDTVTVSDRDGRPLVDRLTLDIPAGGIHVLVGESGSGKSIVCSAIAGTLTDNLSLSGRIVLDGKDLRCLSVKERRALWAKQLFLIPQEPWTSLAQSRSALTQVADMPRLHQNLSRASALATARHRLHQLGLSVIDDGAKWPSQLSGGMCQRIAVATALGAPARLILVDEPTKGLDAQRRDEIAHALRTLLDQGRSMLLVTHDLAFADQFSGRITVLRDGRIVEQGSIQDVLRAPCQPYTRLLVRAAPNNWPRRSWRKGNRVAALEDVTVRGGHRGPVVAEGLSLALHERTVVGLVGPSGSGKTTIGNTLLKLQRPLRGRVDWAASDDRSKFQKLYQNPDAAFAPWRTIADTLSDALAGSGKIKSSLEQEVRPLLREVNLSRSLLQRKPTEVSGGELQRLSLVRAMLCEPLLLFADEPTSRLDQITQMKVMSFIVRLVSERSLSILLVSHDLDLVRAVTNDISQVGCATEIRNDEAGRTAL